MESFMLKYVFSGYSGFSQEIIMYQSTNPATAPASRPDINTYFSIYTWLPYTSP